jgi:hypothetical protein
MTALIDRFDRFFINFPKGGHFETILKTVMLDGSIFPFSKIRNQSYGTIYDEEEDEEEDEKTTKKKTRRRRRRRRRRRFYFFYYLKKIKFKTYLP